MARVPETIDEYLEMASDDQRASLQKLRKTIRAAAPRAEECIIYRLPAGSSPERISGWRSSLSGSSSPRGKRGSILMS